MGLLDNQTEYQYYSNSSKFGNYQFISLQDIISNFSIAYVGEDKIIPKAKRADISFHAHRALQELSFDTFKSTKSQEIEVPASLTMTLPMDYVNYTGLFWVDGTGVERRILPTNNTSDPLAIKQSSDGTYSTLGNNLLQDSDFSTASKPDSFWINQPDVTYDGVNNEVDFTAASKWKKINWNDIPFKVDETYTLKYTITNYSGSGAITPNLFTTEGYRGVFTSRSANGTYEESITITSDSLVVSNYASRFWIQVTTAPFTGSISNLTLKANSLEHQSESNTWGKYKSITPNEIANQDYNVDDEQYDLDLGGRYGLSPSHAQTNGSFFINDRTGKIHFSSNMSGKTIILKYVSDSLGTDSEMQVHKFAEEAMYKHIAYAILSTRLSTPEYIVQRFKRERFAETRKAKLRLSNIKLEEIVQTLRNKSKFIKH